MKKIALLMFAAASIAVVSCGPSAEEKAKMEAAAQAAADSIMKAAEAAMATEVAPAAEAASGDTTT